MEFIIDFEVTTGMRIHWDKNCHHSESAPPCKWAWSTQQFLLEQYFKHSPPDQLHIFQNIHDCSRRTSEDFRRDLAWFIDLLNSSLHPDTDIFYWEATSPNPAKQPRIWANVTSQQCAWMMNDAVRQAIFPFIERTKSQMSTQKRQHAAWHATISLFEPSLRILDWYTDGVHFKPEWYRLVAGTLLGAYCNGKN
jgi:hypothetical protein